MKKSIAETLKDEGLISEEQQLFLLKKEKNNLFSIYWELRIFLYIGITLLTTGLGLLIYENIDSIGHHTIIALMAIVCGGCFWYCWKNKKPFSWQKVENPTAVFDYVLLLGCLLFLSLEGYLQYQYQLFGNKYGLATIIPTVLFFILAYYFDHKGVLGMGISGLALWLGIATSPYDIFDSNNFESIELVISGIILGLILGVAAWKSVKEDLKKHFEFTYLNFSLHLIFISSIIGMIAFHYKWAFVLLVILFCFYFIRYAKETQSFYFLLASTFYGYFTLTYLFTLVVEEFDIKLEVILLYFILSCAGIIFFFLNYKKFLNPSK
jgi:hypothetical protein